MRLEDREPEPGTEDMIREQIAGRGVSDPAVLRAMARVPRSAFVPEEERRHAYADKPLPIGNRQTISQPFMVAHMTALLRLRPTSRVLEIGTGSGYQTAILAMIARHVTSIERHAELAKRARHTLAGLGITNVEIHTGDGSLGWPANAPYDAILVTAAAPAIPNALLDELADGGRLVCPVGAQDMQELTVVQRSGDKMRYEYDTRCVFVPLIGSDAWPAQ